MFLCQCENVPLSDSFYCLPLVLDSRQQQITVNCLNTLTAMPKPFVCLQSSSSDSSNGISSPECAIVVSARPCIHSQNHCSSCDSLTRQPEDCTSSSLYGFHGDSSSQSYDCINRILREAHFSSLQMKARRGLT